VLKIIVSRECIQVIIILMTYHKIVTKEQIFKYRRSIETCMKDEIISKEQIFMK